MVGETTNSYAPSAVVVTSAWATSLPAAGCALNVTDSLAAFDETMPDSFVELP